MSSIVAQSHMLILRSPVDSRWDSIGQQADLFYQSSAVAVAHSLPFASSSQAVELTIPSAHGPGQLNINEGDDQGRTRLHRAVIDGEVAEVRQLLFSGAAVNLKDGQGDEPLRYAIFDRNPELVDLLLRFGAGVETRSHLGHRPLHLAVTSKAILDRLLTLGAASSPQDGMGNTPLHLAVSELSAASQLPGPDTVFDSLIAAGANLNLPNMAGFTPFHTLLVLPSDKSPKETIMSGYISLFLDSGADLSSCLPDGRTPVEAFLARRHRWTQEDKNLLTSETLLKFISKGANPNTRMPSGRLLINECLSGQHSGWNFEDNLNWTLVQLLCEQIDPQVANLEDISILHSLCDAKFFVPGCGKWRIEHERVVITALQRGLDVNRVSHARTPLQCLLHKLPFFTHAKRSFHLFPYLSFNGMLDILLKHGANPLVKDSEDNCPLYSAALLWPTQIQRILLESLIESAKTANLPCCPRTTTTEQRFWATFCRACKADDWVEARDLLESSEVSLPDSVDHKVRQIAFEILGEHHLKSVKQRFEGEPETTERRRCYSATILRDFRRRGVAIKDEFVDYLLDLC